MRSLLLYSLMIAAIAAVFWWLGGARPITTERLIAGALLLPLLAAVVRMKWEAKPESRPRPKRRSASLPEDAPPRP